MWHVHDPFQAVYDYLYSHPELGGPMERKTIAYLDQPQYQHASVEVFTYSPSMRLHIGRECAGPYVLPTPIAYPSGDGRGAAARFTDYQQRWRKAYLDTLRAAKPQFLIFCRMTDYWDLTDPYNTWLHYLPGFDSMLRASYRYDTSFGYYQILKRVD